VFRGLEQMVWLYEFMVGVWGSGFRVWGFKFRV
jgi:hypothetical protein